MDFDPLIVFHTFECPTVAQMCHIWCFFDPKKGDDVVANLVISTDGQMD